jgi:hypothetical protein
VVATPVTVAIDGVCWTVVIVTAPLWWYPVALSRFSDHP